MAALVGLKEFRDRLSGYIQRVEAGEVVTITKRGKPVARVIPAGVPPGMARLMAEGRVRWNGVKPSPPMPHRLAGAGPTATEYVTEDRR